MTGVSRFQSPQVWTGAGALGLAPELVAGAEVHLIVDTSVSALPIVSDAAERMTRSARRVTERSLALVEFTTADVESYVAELAGGFDVVVAIGGGSTIDFAKLVALLSRHGGRVSDYFGEDRVPGPCPTVIAVPTTAGTGSEATPVAVATDVTAGTKAGVSSLYLTPTVALCDPELTLTCPAHVTAHSGADAISHALESLIAPVREVPADEARGRVFQGTTVESRLLATDALRRLVAHIETAVHEGGRLDARLEMMRGATLAGLAFAHSGTGLAHAMQYPIGALTKTSHGLGVGMLTPYVVAVSAAATATGWRAAVEALGLPAESDPRDAVAALVSLNDRIGLPRRLTDIGLARGDFAAVIEGSLRATRLTANVPVPVDAELVERVLVAAMAGEPETLL